MLQRPDPVPVDAVTGLLAAFTEHPLVALGEAHWLQQEADFITRLLQHPEFARTVQIIVVEFGNAVLATCHHPRLCEYASSFVGSF